MTDMDIEGKRVFLDYLCKLIEMREALKGNDHVIQFRDRGPIIPSFLPAMQVSMAYAAGFNVSSIDAFIAQKYNVFCCLGDDIYTGLVDNLAKLDEIKEDLKDVGTAKKTDILSKLLESIYKDHSGLSSLTNAKAGTYSSLKRLKVVLTRTRDKLTPSKLDEIVDTDNIKDIYTSYKKNLQIKLLSGEYKLEVLNDLKASMSRVYKPRLTKIGNAFKSNKTPDLLLCLLNSNEEINNERFLNLFKNKVIHLALAMGTKVNSLKSFIAYQIMSPLGVCYMVTPDIINNDAGWKDSKKFKNIGGNAYQKLGPKAHQTTQLHLDLQEARGAVPGSPEDDLKIVAALKSALHTVETLGDETAKAIGSNPSNPEEFKELHRKIDLIRDRATGELEKKGSNARQTQKQGFEEAEKARMDYYESKAPQATPVGALMNEKDKLAQIKILCKDSNYVKAYEEIIQKLQGIIDGYIKTLQKQLGESINRQEVMGKKISNLNELVQAEKQKGGRRILYKRTRQVFRKNRVRCTKRRRKGV